MGGLATSGTTGRRRQRQRDREKLSMALMAVAQGLSMEWLGSEALSAHRAGRIFHMAGEEISQSCFFKAIGGVGDREGKKRCEK